MFIVVQFESDQSVEVVPIEWVKVDANGSMCAWPPVPANKVPDLVKTNCAPSSHWKQYAVNIKRKCGKHVIKLV